MYCFYVSKKSASGQWIKISIYANFGIFTLMRLLTCQLTCIVRIK